MINDVYGKSIYFGSRYIAITIEPVNCCVLMVDRDTDFSLPLVDERLSRFKVYNSEKDAKQSVKAYKAQQLSYELECQKGVLSSLKQDLDLCKKQKLSDWQRKRDSIKECIAEVSGQIKQTNTVIKQSVPLEYSQDKVISMFHFTEVSA